MEMTQNENVAKTNLTKMQYRGKYTHKLMPQIMVHQYPNDPILTPRDFSLAETLRTSA